MFVLTLISHTEAGPVEHHKNDKGDLVHLSYERLYELGLLVQRRSLD